MVRYMKIDIVQRKADIGENQINVIIESNENNPYAEDFANYVKQFNKDNIIKEKVMVYDGEIIKAINYQEIMCFYSKNRINYCRTKDTTYKIKSSLYELEKVNHSFVRISRKCIVNSNNVKHFEMNNEGRMVVVFSDGTEERVSRRNIKQVEKFLDERRI